MVVERKVGHPIRSDPIHDPRIMVRIGSDRIKILYPNHDPWFVDRIALTLVFRSIYPNSEMKITAVEETGIFLFGSGYWRANSHSYPILASMAKDYLTVQASSVASERASRPVRIDLCQIDAK